MSIAFVQAKTSSGAGQDVTATMNSTPTNGNLLVAMVSVNGTRTMNAQTGWTKLTEVTGTNTGGLYWKRAQAGETTLQYPVQHDGITDVWVIAIAEYSGIDTPAPVEAETGNADNDATKTTTGSCNPTDGVERLVIGGAFSANNGTWSSQKVNGSTTGVTERGDIGAGAAANVTSSTLFEKIDTSTVSGNYTAEAVSSATANGAAFIAIFDIPTPTDGDRRYGSGNKYGNGRLYGTSDNPIVDDRFQWGVVINWDSKYGEENEAIYMTSFQMFRGRRDYLNPNGQGFAPIETGRARITLDNSSGRYDAWNTSSPLYPNVQPGKDIRIKLRDLDSGSTYDVFTGIILDIETIGYGADARVILVCEDGWYFLRNNVTYVGLTRQSFTISRILGMIFGLENNYFINPFTYRYGTNFESASDTIRFWWSSNNISIADMCTDLAQSFFCKFFIANDGTATFYDRTNARTSVQSITQSILLKDISNRQPWNNQRDSLKIKVHARKVAANQVVWSLAEPVQVLEGETETLNPVFTLDGFVVPVYDIAFNPGDYHASTVEGGGGTDLSSDFILYDPVTPNDVVGASYGHGLGDTMVVTVINNSSLDGYLNDFIVNAIPVYESGTTLVSYPPVVGSNRRELLIDSLWHQKIGNARTIARIYGPQIAAVRQFPMITFDTRPEGLVPDLFDIETVSITALGISSTAFEVGGIEIETTNETCQSFIVRHYLEPHFASS